MARGIGVRLVGFLERAVLLFCFAYFAMSTVRGGIGREKVEMGTLTAEEIDALTSRVQSFPLPGAAPFQLSSKLLALSWEAHPVRSSGQSQQ